jgi:hypothetical protein
MNSSEFWKKAFELRTKYFIETFVHVAKVIIDRYGDEGRKLIKQGRFNAGLIDGKKMAKIAEERKLEKNAETFILLMKEFYPWGTINMIKSSKELVVIHDDKCLPYETFKELNALDLAELYCVYDHGLAEGFNPALKLKITKYMPKGDPYCEEVYQLKV